MFGFRKITPPAEKIERTITICDVDRAFELVKDNSMVREAIISYWSLSYYMMKGHSTIDDAERLAIHEQDIITKLRDQGIALAGYDNNPQAILNEFVSLFAPTLQLSEEAAAA